MRTLLLVTALLLSSLGIAAAESQGLLTERNLSSALAVEIAEGAVHACLERGYRVTAAVVDRNAQLKALIRADGAGPHTIDSSQRKAFTASSLRTGTTALDEMVRGNPAATGLRDVPGFLLLGGGVVIRAGDQVVGAVGVGGAPGGHLDDQCAQVGIDKVKGRLVP